ncbi:hypothetical protein GGR53DRAFT_471467 [Hypoxylon sp. FL1150]|nr:hypothetical protein GGR53DRAFT_471467 [Hypoxylon sp. FL1150]
MTRNAIEKVSLANPSPPAGDCRDEGRAQDKNVKRAAINPMEPSAAYMSGTGEVVGRVDHNRESRPCDPSAALIIEFNYSISSTRSSRPSTCCTYVETRRRKKRMMARPGDMSKQVRIHVALHRDLHGAGGEKEVYDVEGLRVVDSSAVPLIIKANIEFTIYAFAEKAADRSTG